MSAIGLGSDRAAPPKDLEVRPKQVKAWLDSLPIAQSVEAAKKVLAHVSAMNRAKVDVDARIQILEHYRPIVAVILDELDAVYSRATLPLGPRAREALKLARELGMEIASGYRIAVAEKTTKVLAFGARKQMPSLLHGAIEYLVGVQRASYKAYSPVPEGIWKELHRLYLVADKEAMTAEVVDAESKATIADTYGEALLMSLTDPYRLVQGEVDRILAQIRGARGLISLGQAKPATRASGHFMVPCDTDRPPKPALSANDDGGGPNWRIFDTNAIVDRLRARKQAIETGNVSATTSKSVGPEGLALLGKLITLWGNPPKRAHRRDPMETTVVVCAGLKSATHYVALDTEIIAHSEAEKIRAGITMPLVAVPDDEASKAHPVHEWDVVNQSLGGVKLRRIHDSIPTIVVGEVVALKFIGKVAWTVGVVRWITQLDDGGMEFGVQFLSQNAFMVWVQPALTDSPQAKPGLMFADDENDEALLTPPSTYADTREFELSCEGNITRVRAGGLIEKTGRFELFHVSPS